MIDPNFKHAHRIQRGMIARATILARWLVCAIMIAVALGILLVTNRCSGAAYMDAPPTPSTVGLIIPVSTPTYTMDRSGGKDTLPNPRSNLEAYDG